MIEFDDAGIGCPIGGVVFVARRVETDEMAMRYQTLRDREERRIEEILFELVEELHVEQHEEILLCRGYIFHSFENYLKQKGFEVSRGKIIGKTNDVAEDGFIEELRKIGLPHSVVVHHRDFERFHEEVMLWYKAFYKGENIIKKKAKVKTKDYILNRVHCHPHLVAQLLEMNTEKELVLNC